MKPAIEQLQEHVLNWGVTVDRTVETPTSIVAFGERDGLAVVLKASRSLGDESYSGAVLKAFAGDGSVNVHEYDVGVVLLECLDPGDQLVTLVRRGDDEEATRIISGVVAKLANHSPPASCPTVGKWGRAFDRYLESGDMQISLELVQQARAMYQRLDQSQRRTMLLHGDLQHYNVLFDARRGWVAIDPKGVVGELEYEISPILRNPIELPELFSSPETIKRRLNFLTKNLPLDPVRVIEWSFAQSVLSAIWDVEDGYAVGTDNPGLRLATVLKSMLG
jgi:streptomycin 6-kinase